MNPGLVTTGRFAGRVLVILALAMTAGCGLLRSDDGDDRAEPAPAATDTARATRGNPPFYDEFGQRYYVLPTAAGYRERGVASWYGKKFHGRPTSSGERYDMHAYTAAHATLPLPTYARVTNLRNGASVVVRINDRGPFVKNRLIDLSYAAASRLDMIEAGTTLVEVETIDPHSGAPVTTDADAAEHDVFVQVGAYGNPRNAERIRTKLYNYGIEKVVVAQGDSDTGRPVHRVRIGPLDDIATYDALVERLQALGFSETHLTTE